jgi:hypothetical protein
MQEDAEYITPEAWLQNYAKQLDSWRAPEPSLEPFFELLSGALVWRDEIPPNVPTEVTWALRFVWCERTNIMFEKPRRFPEFWKLSRQLFPNWVGFYQTRCTYSRQYAIIYRAGSIGLEKCLREMDAEYEDKASDTNGPPT